VVTDHHNVLRIAQVRRGRLAEGQESVFCGSFAANLNWTFNRLLLRCTTVAMMAT